MNKNELRKFPIDLYISFSFHAIDIYLTTHQNWHFSLSSKKKIIFLSKLLLKILHFEICFHMDFILYCVSSTEQYLHHHNNKKSNIAFDSIILLIEFCSQKKNAKFDKIRASISWNCIHVTI